MNRMVLQPFTRSKSKPLKNQTVDLFVLDKAVRKTTMLDSLGPIVLPQRSICSWQFRERPLVTHCPGTEIKCRSKNLTVTSY